MCAVSPNVTNSMNAIEGDCWPFLLFYFIYEHIIKVYLICNYFDIVLAAVHLILIFYKVTRLNIALVGNMSFRMVTHENVKTRI